MRGAIRNLAIITMIDRPAMPLERASMPVWLFHRHGLEAFTARGTEAQARAYWHHLNSGLCGNLWAMRPHHNAKTRGVNLAAELLKIAKGKRNE
jgi:hypothetical protein